MALDIRIDRKSGVPLYLQVKRQIEHLIRTGVWEKGQKLPTERDLSRTLGVSRNTVSMAYQELVEEGILFSHQGSGTYVAEADDIFRREGKKERLLRIIDMCLEETVNLGFTLDEFISIAQARAKEKKELLRRVKVAFVECNREQLDYFAHEVELGAGVSVVPILIDDWRARPAEVERIIAEVDLVVTTFFHLEEVKERMKGRDKEILGIALDPQLDTIVKIARLPRGKKVGMVCLSQAFAERVKKSLQNAGLGYGDLKYTTTRDEKELQAFLPGLDAVIVSPGRKKEVERLVGRGVEIIEFVYRPDAGSLSLLKTALLEGRRRLVGQTNEEGRRQ